MEKTLAATITIIPICLVSSPSSLFSWIGGNLRGPQLIFQKWLVSMGPRLCSRGNLKDISPVRPRRWASRASRTGLGRMEVRCLPPFPSTMCGYPPEPSRCSTFKAATSETRSPQPAMSHKRAASRGVGAAASNLCHSSRVRKSSACML